MAPKLKLDSWESLTRTYQPLQNARLFRRYSLLSLVPRRQFEEKQSAITAHPGQEC